MKDNSTETHKTRGFWIYDEDCSSRDICIIGVNSTINHIMHCAFYLDYCFRKDFRLKLLMDLENGLSILANNQ